MKISEIARAIEARLVVPCTRGDPEISRIYGGQAMSDLIANAAADTLLFTPLNNTQLIRVADLMDVPGLCLVAGSEPAEALVAHARASGTALLVCRWSLRHACEAAQAALREQAARP